MDESSAGGQPADIDGVALPPPVDASSAARHRGPSPMMRFLVVVIGVTMLGMGRGVQQVGGVVGVGLGGLIELVAVAIIAIAAGLVEWWVHRRRRSAVDRAPTLDLD